MIKASFEERSMCEYTSTYLNLIDNSHVSYSCPHTPRKKTDRAAKRPCIFHDPREDKDAEAFYQEFVNLYRSSQHVFCGFVFPKTFDFPRLKKELGSLTFNNAVFTDAIFACNTDFSGALFTGDGGVNFIEASFQAPDTTSFGNARFEGPGGANFRMANFSGSGITNFSRAVFSGGPVDFTWAKFAVDGGVDFKLAEFSGAGSADFHFAEFTGKVANFTGCSFGKDGGANFSLIQFAGGDGANFSSTKFTGEGQANFSTTNFSGRGGANFNKARFSCDGGANFSLAQLTGKSKANFMEARFTCNGPVNFSRARFSGGSGADFRDAQFNSPGGVSFSGATFAGGGRIYFGGRTFFPGTTVDFTDISFENPERVIFDTVDLSRARFLLTDVTKINFIRIAWCGRRYNSSLFSGRVKVFDELFQERGRMLRWINRLLYALKAGVAVGWIIEKTALLRQAENDKPGSFLKRCRVSLVARARVWAAKKERNHWEVYRLYNQLMVNYANAYRYHEAGDFFAGRMEMRRRENFENPFVRIGLWFYRLFSLFGERPAYALGWLILVVALSGLVNLKIGIAQTPAEPAPMAVEETAVASPAPQPIDDRSGVIRYGSISPGDFTSPAFRNDYLRALSVTLGVFLPDQGTETPVLADPLYGRFAVLAEILLCVLFFFLFAAGVWRKFGRRAV
jgi:hypothetical protein